MGPGAIIGLGSSLLGGVIELLVLKKQLEEQQERKLVYKKN
jgi:hypothetical protein